MVIRISCAAAFMACAWLRPHLVSAQQLRPAGTVQGVVRDSAGQPIERAEAYVMPSGPGVFTNAAGHFVIQNVTAGEHRVIVRHIGFQPELSDIVVAEGVLVEADVQLARMPALLAEQFVNARRDRFPRVYERLDKHIGLQLFSEDLEQYRHANLTDVFEKFSPRLRGVLHAPLGCGVNPIYYLDGRHVPPTGWDDSAIGDFVNVDDIAVIEAFKSSDFVNEPFIGDDGALAQPAGNPHMQLGTTGAIRGGTPLASAKTSGASCQRIVLIWTKYFAGQRVRAADK